MTFRLDLNLEAIKGIIGWDDSYFYDYSYPLPRYEPRLPVYKLHLPCRLTYTARLSSPNDIGAAIEDLRNCCIRLSRELLNTDDIFGLGKKLTPLVSEALSNILEHGGEGIKEEATIIEHYHPADGKRFILRITNPRTREWDYERAIGSGYERCGLGAFSSSTFAQFSYENKGKDLLALVTIRP